MRPTPLLCFPFAGAGASFFRAWRRIGVPGVDVVPVELPGRERRIDEAPFTDVGTAVSGLLPEILRSLPSGDPVALFGHSMGAVLAYETARALLARGTRVARLFVSGSPGPWPGRDTSASGLDDDLFLARVEEFAGYRDAVLDSPDLRALVLPILRADVQMHENYRPARGDPFPVPITSIRGMDDKLVSSRQAELWREFTSAGFDTEQIPGGHMYLTGAAREVLDIVRRRLCRSEAVRG